MRNFLLTTALLILAWPQLGWAQSPSADTSSLLDDSEGASPDAENSGVEDLYDSFDREESKKKAAEVKTERTRQQKNVGTLTDLATLAPFEDVAVIQRRFLPKTGRFELSPNGMITLNNPFFTNMGLGLRASYYFLEKHGLELQYFTLSNSSRAVTKNLEDKRQVRTQSLTVAKSYMGAAYKWNPVYGKMSLMNNVIVPFDLYFTIGGGLTSTNEADGESTVHIGTGQSFALSKKIALRWDLTWNFYAAEATDSAGKKITNNQDDLFLSVGMSFFVPEAKYR